MSFYSDREIRPLVCDWMSCLYAKGSGHCTQWSEHLAYFRQKQSYDWDSMAKHTGAWNKSSTREREREVQTSEDKFSCTYTAIVLPNMRLCKEYIPLHVLKNTNALKRHNLFIKYSVISSWTAVGEGKMKWRRGRTQRQREVFVLAGQSYSFETVTFRQRNLPRHSNSISFSKRQRNSSKRWKKWFRIFLKVVTSPTDTKYKSI